MNIELRILVQITAVTLIFGQNVEKNATNNVTDVNTQNNALFTPSPLEIVCNHTENCQRYNDIHEPKYKDLRTRKCMCDPKCVTYGDCCEDSGYYNQTFKGQFSLSCENTFKDGYIYMVKKCAPDYPNPTMIKNCESTSRTDLVENFLLGIPVSDMAMRVTFKNAYCAICNNLKSFTFWEPRLYFKLEKLDFDIILKNTSASSSSDKNSYSVTINPEAILSNLKINEKRTQLVSVVAGSSYLCDIVPIMPPKVQSVVRFCLPHSNDRLCSDCEKTTPTNSCIASLDINYSNTKVLNWDDPRLPIIYTCNDVPDDVSQNAKQKFCEPDIELCFYTLAGELCLVNTVYKIGEYEFTGDGSVYIQQLRAVFPHKEYTNQTTGGDGGSIYVCGTEIPRSDRDKFFTKLRDVLAKIFMKFSIFFLILYLVINANKKKLQSLPNKVLFSFCITLLLYYTVLEITQVKESCIIESAVLHYLFLSCIVWLLIASLDFWQVICRSSTKLQTLAGKTRLKRYLLYCFFGWISPCSIMAVAIYFEVAYNRTIPCYLKPAYGRLKQCFIAHLYPKRYFFLYPATAVFCIIIALFVHTSYHIYQSKRKNITSTAQNNYYVLFVKLALSMGVTWTTGLFVTYADSNIINTLYITLNSSHGIFLFFAYCFKRTMLNKMYEKHKNISIVQQTVSTFVSISDKIKNPASQSTASTGHTTQEMESAH